MNENQSRLIMGGLFALAIIVSGFVLSRGGKPYHVAIFTVHKLIALAAVALFFITLYRLSRESAPSGGEIIAALGSALCFVTLFATGALLSLSQPMPDFVRVVHHIAPYPALLCAAVTLLLLNQDVIARLPS
jgi:hypothetical protein